MAAKTIDLTEYAQERLLLDELQLADYNPRRITRRDMDKLKASLREFGFVESVVVREEDYLVIGGHQRIAAMREIAKEDNLDPGTITVPAILVTGITDERAKLLNVALNKIQGDWDLEKLGAMLAAEDLKKLDVSLTGFDSKELDDIFRLTVDFQNYVPPPEQGDNGGGPSKGARGATGARKSTDDGTLHEFAFKVTSSDDAAMVRRVIERFGGIHGEKSEATAFIRAMEQALSCMDL